MRHWGIRLPGWATVIAVASITVATCADSASALLPGKCQGLSGAALGICVSFCEAHQCYTLPDRNSCQVLRSAFQKLTRKSVFPCELPSSAIRAATATPTPAATPTATLKPTPALFVYWDQNEEEDAIAPGGHPVQLVAPWDPNGQMCIFPDSSARAGQFVTGYNPTLPSQHNLGGTLPYKNPPVGMAVWDRHGVFTEKTIYVPGPFALPGMDPGGDIPPDTGSTFCADGVTPGHCASDDDCLPGTHCSGTFNDNGSFTGCAFNSRGDLFAADIGQSQGGTPVPQGRIIEWFPPDYTSYCIIIGPTDQGDGPHHVNGTGGLLNPGTMAMDPQDNLYVPETGAGRVLRFDHSVLPQSAAECDADGLLSPPAPYTVFIEKGLGPLAGIARDPSCSTDTANCWAVSEILSGTSLGTSFNAVYWFDDAGMPFPGKGPLPRGDFTPFGLAVGPDGDLFFVSTGLTCTLNPFGCDTIDDGGGLYHVTFANGVPSAPEKIASGLNFPVGVTVCDASEHICPEPVLEATPVVQPTATGGG
jgi:hypothetical protein